MYRSRFQMILINVYTLCRKITFHCILFFSVFCALIIIATLFDGDFKAVELFPSLMIIIPAVLTVHFASKDQSSKNSIDFLVKISKDKKHIKAEKEITARSNIFEKLPCDNCRSQVLEIGLNDSKARERIYNCMDEWERFAAGARTKAYNEQLLYKIEVDNALDAFFVNSYYIRYELNEEPRVYEHFIWLSLLWFQRENYDSQKNYLNIRKNDREFKSRLNFLVKYSYYLTSTICNKIDSIFGVNGENYLFFAEALNKFLLDYCIKEGEKSFDCHRKIDIKRFDSKNPNKIEQNIKNPIPNKSLNV